MPSKQIQNKYDEIISFPDAVDRHLKRKNMKRGDLARKGQFSRATISRFFRNKNDKGSSYRPAPEVVMCICIALKLDENEMKELFLIAFPEWKCWIEISRRKLSMHDANVLLDENGLSTLGNSIEE